jgi:hypothetical protein
MDRFDGVMHHLLWMAVFFGAALLLPALMPLAIVAVVILSVSAVRVAVRG